MPWVTALLHGKTVWARALPDGTFVVENGFVSVRYKPKDARLYRARATNLAPIPGGQILDDAECAEAADVVPKPKPARGNSSWSEKAPPNAYRAYTDGACSGNPGEAGAGVVLVDPNGNQREAYAYLEIGTKHIAELEAIRWALRLAKERRDRS